MSTNQLTGGRNVASVTPSDSTDLTRGNKLPKAIYVGGAGDVAIADSIDGAAVTLVGVVAGTVLPVRPTRVMSTNTTATSIVALY